MNRKETGAMKLVAKIKSLLGGTSMDRELMIHNLQEADLGFDAESLEKIDDNVLEWMNTHISEETEEVETEIVDTEDEETEVIETEVIETEDEVTDEVIDTDVDETEVTVNEYLKTNGVDLEEVLTFMQEKKDAEAKERNDLLEALIGNEKCGITDEALGKMETCVLKELTSAYKPGSYIGVAVPCKPCAKTGPPAAPSIILNTNKEGE